jgi:Putative restriction endonuclease
MMATAFDKRIPPLAAGDTLTREEFLRRWEAHPEIKNAELIGGMVFMPSPVSAEHGEMESDLGTWLGVYRAATPGTASGHNTTSFILDDTPQPDLNLRLLPEFGGRSRVENRYLQGIPELLAEVCRSSASYDCMQRQICIKLRACPSTWLFCSSSERSAGMLWSTGSTSFSSRKTACGARGSFPACGWTVRHYWPVTSNRFSDDCKTG